VSVLLGWAGVGGDASTWLTAAVTGLLVPIWAIWLGRSATAPLPEPSDPVAAGASA
jgi:hypothetical protein